jgi:outer membrane receptor protein involved in Fe transport
MSFRGEGALHPFSTRWQKGFFVHFRRHRARARYAGWVQSHLGFSAALLVGGAVAIRSPAASAQTPPVYESVVESAPIPTEAPREDRAASASVITEDRTPRAAETVTELLGEQAGTSVTRLGGMGATATLSLRGSTANQVLVYVDGVPFNTATGGGVDLGAIPLGDVSRIEIYRGMSPIAFGASGIGGVVSIATEIPKQNRINLDAGGGAFGTYWGGLTTAYNRGRFHGYAGLHLLTTDGDFEYLNDHAMRLDSSQWAVERRRDNDLRQVDGVARAVFDLSTERHLGASFSFFDRDQGLPDGGTVNDSTARLGSRRGVAMLNYRSSQDLGAASDLRATLYGEHVTSDLFDPDHKVARISADDRDRTLTAGVTVDWRKLARDWLTLSGVLDARFEGFRPSDANQSGAPATRYFGAAGLEGDVWIERWRLDVIASARIEGARTETSGRNNFDELMPTSPPVNNLLPIGRLSLVKQLGQWTALRANAGRYARLPSTIELYGNTGYLLGNPNLRPESGLNVDLGPQVDWRRGDYRVTWSAAGFASFVDDLIQYRFVGGPVVMENLGKARIYGVESDATLELGAHVRVTGAATFTDARDMSSNEAHHGQPLPFRPRYRLYARPDLRRIRLGSHVTLGLYADIDATAGNYLVPNGSAKADARMLVGAGLYLDLPAHFRVRASARNLANQRVNDLLNYPLPGREIYLSLIWSSQEHQTKGASP